MKIAVLFSVCASLCASAAFAQQPSPASPPPQAADSAAAQPKTLKPSSAQAEAGEPRATTGETVPSPARAPAAASKASNNAADKLQLGTATVTGDREQPKVMYVVPWKKSDIGDLGGKPMNSLVDEILAPVDRDVFKREVSYYQTMKSQASQNGAQPAPVQGEK
jgi:hypothetical protein